MTAGPLYYATYRVGIWIIETVALVLDSPYRFALWEAARLRERHRRTRAEADLLRADPVRVQGEQEEEDPPAAGGSSGR